MSLMELKASEIDDTIHAEQQGRKPSIAPSPSENNNGATVKQPQFTSIITGYSLSEMIEIIEQDLFSLAFEVQSLV